MMRLGFLVEFDDVRLAGQPELVRDLPQNEEGRIRVMDALQLSSVLDRLERVPSITVCSIIDFSDDNLEVFDFYQVLPRRRISLPLNVWQYNFDKLVNGERVFKGGWSPVAIPKGFVCPLKLKRKPDLAYLVDGSTDMVISEELLKPLQAMDPQLRGEMLFTGIRKAQPVVGLKQLYTEHFAQPCIRSVSLTHLGGLREWVDGFPDSTLVHLGLPTLPRVMKHAAPGMMWSAEPWSAFLSPGWIATSDVARMLASQTKDVVLHPVLTEGTELHMMHEALWHETRAIVDGRLNVEWGAPWEVEDMSSRLRVSE
jgi:hypothetical protein